MRKLMRLPRALWRLLQRRGGGYLVYLITGYLLPALGYQLLLRLPRFWLRRLMIATAAATSVVVLALLLWLLGPRLGLPVFGAMALLFAVLRLAGRPLWLAAKQRRARELTARAREQFQPAPRLWSQLAIEPEMRRSVERARLENPNGELVLGRFDSDGRVESRFGKLPYLSQVEPDQFLERIRFRLEVVLIGDVLLVRKDFRGDRSSFVAEWLTLATLAGRTNVPAVYRVDEERCVLYKDLVLGPTVRELLVDAGAEILHAQTQKDPELQALTPSARAEAVVARGTEKILSCLSESFLLSMEEQMDAIHAGGVSKISTTFGNVIQDPNNAAAWFIDMEGNRIHRSTASPLFRYERDRDRINFNKRYRRNLITEQSARELLAALGQKSSGWYAPIDFGNGLTVGSFWSTESGSGRWDYLNRRVMAPYVSGKRILDLGCNNGVMSLMMLRAGAREVIGVERSAEAVEKARSVHRLFEWRDLRRYAFQVQQADMRAILEAEWGDFDVITAFCSLYYLSPEDIERVIRRAAQLVPIMVVQANVATRADAAENKAEKSSVCYLRSQLERNGFPRVETYSPKGYSRPLLVGRRADAV